MPLRGGLDLGPAVARAAVAQELAERDPAELREARYCEGCGAAWIATLGERAAAGWERWCDTCADLQRYHRTTPAVRRRGGCSCQLCDTRRALAASYAWTPRVMVERPQALQDEDARARLPKRPYIAQDELAAAKVA